MADGSYGTAHLGYFVPLTKIADFLKAGVAVKVLLAGKLILCACAISR